MRRSVLAVLLALLVALVGCSSEKKVGSGIDVEALDAKARRLGKLDLPKENEGGGGFVGEKEKAAEEQQTQQNESTAAEEEQLQRLREASSVAFNITRSGYDPYYIRVFKGGVISVTNRDAAARTVTADRGEFDSGSIPPGETWTYTADRIGKFNFHDGTRPFVVGTLEVLAE
jgi:plastocyanin